MRDVWCFEACQGVLGNLSATCIPKEVKYKMFQEVIEGRAEFLQRENHLLYLLGRVRRKAVIKYDLGSDLRGMCTLG